MHLPTPLPAPEDRRPEDRCRGDRADDGLQALSMLLQGGLRSEAFAEDLGFDAGNSGIAQSRAARWAPRRVPRAAPHAVLTRVVSCCSYVMSVLPGRAATTA